MRKVYFSFALIIAFILTSPYLLLRYANMKIMAPLEKAQQQHLIRDLVIISHFGWHSSQIEIHARPTVKLPSQKPMPPLFNLKIDLRAGPYFDNTEQLIWQPLNIQAKLQRAADHKPLFFANATLTWRKDFQVRARLLATPHTPALFVQGRIHATQQTWDIDLPIYSSNTYYKVLGLHVELQRQPHQWRLHLNAKEAHWKTLSARAIELDLLGQQNESLSLWNGWSQLRHGADLTIHQFHAQLPQGTIRLQGDLHLPRLNFAEDTSPMGRLIDMNYWLAYAKAGFNLQLPSATFTQLLSFAHRLRLPALQPHTPQHQIRMLAQQLGQQTYRAWRNAQLIETNPQQQIHCRAHFAQGLLRLNGKPYDILTRLDDIITTWHKRS